jgi:transcriptional regulator with XRE-family HTH domain
MSATARLRPPPARSARLGERVRQLRVAAGLTQTDLAGERFSKEYVSQIERGKTAPTRETIEWLAASSASTPASSRRASRPTSAAASRRCSPARRR